MKKTISVLVIVLLLVGSVFALAACSNKDITVDKCWANNEKLTYAVLDGDREVGSLDITLDADPDDKTLPYGDETRTYSSANVRISETLVRSGEATVTTTILADNYTVLAVNKVYTDLSDNANSSYSLQSYHDGKNYVYTLQKGDQTVSEKLKVGASGYTDNEFLYYYIRCYNINAIPSSVKVADPIGNSVRELNATFIGETSVVTACPEIGTATCNAIYITLKETPSGSGIYAYYLPDNDNYRYGDFLIKSAKYPVKLVENNITYLLKSQEARYQ